MEPQWGVGWGWGVKGIRSCNPSVAASAVYMTVEFLQVIHTRTRWSWFLKRGVSFYQNLSAAVLRPQQCLQLHSAAVLRPQQCLQLHNSGQQQIWGHIRLSSMFMYARVEYWEGECSCWSSNSLDNEVCIDHNKLRVSHQSGMRWAGHLECMGVGKVNPGC